MLENNFSDERINISCQKNQFHRHYNIIFTFDKRIGTTSAQIQQTDFSFYHPLITK